MRSMPLGHENREPVATRSATDDLVSLYKGTERENQSATALDVIGVPSDRLLLTRSRNCRFSSSTESARCGYLRFT